jgi:hypothetical protein
MVFGEAVIGQVRKPVVLKPFPLDRPVMTADDHASSHRRVY